MGAASASRQILRKLAVRRRGAVYLATLGASMIIVVIGVSALLAARVQNRTAQMAHYAQVAQHAAESSIEFARLTILNDSSWRTRFSNDTWTTDIALGDATFTFKLVDEADGNLANDATQSVRLYAKGQAGSATRLLSVELAPDSAAKMQPVTGSWRQEVQ